MKLQSPGDTFVSQVKMLIAPIIFTTVVVGLAGIMLLLGMGRFMSEARAITNFIGNTVAILVIARWEGAFDASKVAALLARPRPKGDA